MSKKEEFLYKFIQKYGTTLATYCKDFPLPKKCSYETHVLKHAWKHSLKLTR